MSLNTKNPEAERLARELAARTGESVTQAVTAALRERLDRVVESDGLALAARTNASGKSRTMPPGDGLTHTDRSITEACFMTRPVFPSDRRHFGHHRHPPEVMTTLIRWFKP